MPYSKSANAQIPGWLTSQPIAHRGLHDLQGGIAENSLSSFQKAIDADVAIEFDVHLSSDGHPIVFHDATLQRVAADPRYLADVTAAELQSLNLSGFTDTIPLLSTALELVDGRVPLVIEIKSTSPKNRKKLVHATWKTLETYSGPFAIQSFDPFVLIKFRKMAPHILRGQLATKSAPDHLSFQKKMIIRHMLLNRFSRPHYIGYDIKHIAQSSVQRAVKPGMALLAWTVDSTADLAAAKQYADNIIFEKLPMDLIQKR